MLDERKATNMYKLRGYLKKKILLKENDQMFPKI